MDPDQALYGRALSRIRRWMLAITAAGAAAGWFFSGWNWGAGFLAGAVASYLNFRWLKQLVESLGETGRRRPRARVAVVLGLRYAGLAAGGYAIVNYSSLSLSAALAGLFVAVAAVIAEILFELIYAGT
ncbi:MAG: ATP synthase subunit I [Bryobacterales bacterium]|nr:ATP synthase subunit I [Bryobacterales bacterium]